MTVIITKGFLINIKRFIVKILFVTLLGSNKKICITKGEGGVIGKGCVQNVSQVNLFLSVPLSSTTQPYFHRRASSSPAVVEREVSNSTKSLKFFKSLKLLESLKMLKSLSKG